MGGFQSAMASLAPQLVSGAVDLGTTALTDDRQNDRPVVVQPPPIDEDPRVEDILNRAEQREESTLREHEQREIQREEELESEQAQARVRAAANNTAGGGSTEAVLDDNRQDTARAQQFDDARTRQQMDRIDADRRRNLLDVARERRRTAIGLRRQLQER